MYVSNICTSIVDRFFIEINFKCIRVRYNPANKTNKLNHIEDDNSIVIFTDAYDVFYRDNLDIIKKKFINIIVIVEKIILKALL